MNQQEMEEFRVYRTLEGTVFEIITGLIVLAAIVFCCISYARQGVFSKDLVQPIILAAVAGSLLCCAYHPNSSWVNLPRTMKTEANAYKSARLLRILAVELSLSSLAYSLLLNGFFNHTKMTENTLDVLAVILIVSTLSGFVIFARRS